jgi:hypothetical protein
VPGGVSFDVSRISGFEIVASDGRTLDSAAFE